MTQKKQHIVPVFYLKNFYSQYLLSKRKKTKKQLEAREYPIYVYDKLAEKSFCKSISDVAYGGEDYFYRIETDRTNINKNTFVETDFLTPIDTKFSEIYKEIIEKLEVSRKQLEKIKELEKISQNEIYAVELINDDVKRDIAPWIYLQAIRTKAFRSFLESHLDEIAVSSINNEHMKVLCNEDLLKKYSSWIQEQIWIIGYNTTQQPFFTSDHPVTVVDIDNRVNNLIDHDPFLVKGRELHFPLTSQYILEILDREYYQEFIRFDKYLVRLTEFQLIDQLNQRQVEQSYQQIYCSQDNFNVCQKLK